LERLSDTGAYAVTPYGAELLQEVLAIPELDGFEFLSAFAFLDDLRAEAVEAAILAFTLDYIHLYQCPVGRTVIHGRPIRGRRAAGPVSG